MNPLKRIWEQLKIYFKLRNAISLNPECEYVWVLDTDKTEHLVRFAEMLRKSREGKNDMVVSKCLKLIKKEKVMETLKGDIRTRPKLLAAIKEVLYEGSYGDITKIVIEAGLIHVEKTKSLKNA